MRLAYGRRTRDLLGLLDESDQSEDHGEDVKEVTHDVQDVPHVTYVLPEALVAYLLDFFPQETFCSHREDRG